MLQAPKDQQAVTLVQLELKALQPDTRVVLALKVPLVVTRALSVLSHLHKDTQEAQAPKD